MPNSRSPMPTLTFRNSLPASAEDVYAWHGRPGAFQRLQPPWERITVANIAGTFGTDGYRISFHAPLLGPIKGTWFADAYDFQPGKQFQDRQLKGPFAYWNHKHRFLAEGPQSSLLEDQLDYRPPL